MPEPRKPTDRQINTVASMLDANVNRRRRAIERTNPPPSWEAIDAWRRKHPDPAQRHKNMITRKLAPAKKAIEVLLYNAKMGFIDVVEFDRQARALAEKIAPRTATAQE